MCSGKLFFLSRAREVCHWTSEGTLDFYLYEEEPGHNLRQFGALPLFIHGINYILHLFPCSTLSKLLVSGKSYIVVNDKTSFFCRFCKINFKFWRKLPHGAESGQQQPAAAWWEGRWKMIFHQDLKLIPDSSSSAPALTSGLFLQLFLSPTSTQHFLLKF